MQTLEQSLAELVQRGVVTTEVALESSSYPEQLLALLGRSDGASNGESAHQAGLRVAGS